ncbi:MAG: four helix bundle protein [Nitrospirota bacterium]
MKGNDKLRQRFYEFALLIIKFVRNLPKEMVAYEIGKQLLRSGTSIATNYEEATGAFSKDDFIYKISVAFKEAKETNLWLRLLKDSGIFTKDIDALIQESEEIRNILGKSVTTAKRHRQ